MFLVGVLYRPPNSNSNIWNLFSESVDKALDCNLWDLFSESVDKSLGCNYPIFLCGDFNCDMMSNTSSSFKKLLNRLNLENVVWESTNFTTQTGTCIDLCVTNRKNLIKSVTILTLLHHCYKPEIPDNNELLPPCHLIKFVINEKEILDQLKILNVNKPAGSEGKHLQYIGCYVDQSTPRTLPDGYLKLEGDMTNDVCLDYCCGSLTTATFMGIEDADHCFCSTVARSTNFVPRNDPDSGLICNIPCSGNQSEICGGFWSLSTYKIGKRR
ncbi:unnamed protein product [Mytilus edulis]|uniref:WSC domain-containing protein n=1 Tax=Mytilus edulis TaxID=6550 RepID=A0A8S3S5A8_MYTED|nr:unnamed protein product [Mytilus edulis]